jgi:hypothetical protein
VINKNKKVLIHYFLISIVKSSFKGDCLKNKLIILLILLISMMATGCTGSDSKEESTAGAQWIEYYSRNSELIDKDFKNIEEARNTADMAALSNSGSSLYYDSLTAIEERKMITSDFSTVAAGANDERFQEALEHSKEAGSCIVSEVYELKQGRKSQAEEYKHQATVNINFYHTDSRDIDTDIY